MLTILCQNVFYYQSISELLLEESLIFTNYLSNFIQKISVSKVLFLSYVNIFNRILV